mmetsp:Transcript_32392/g.60993  ORF Transcript_32392/g.60993 Transcript_32392/m.60993 type:complete len:257 (+) Transcript_32392:27-797(+)
MGAMLSNASTTYSLWFAVGAVAVAALVYGKRSAATTALPDISVPEALYAMARARNRRIRAACARALTGIMSGEVQVLEEILDESKGRHPEFGGHLPGGRGVLSVVLEDLSCNEDCAEDTEAFADLLLQCTAFDVNWDETDEWNQLTLQAMEYLRKDLKAEQFLLVAERSNSAAVSRKVSVLRRRLGGQWTADAPPGSENSDVPGMLSMNTRVQCPVCMTMQADLLRCPTCRNVGYCCAQHLQDDGVRHRYWCSGRD